ncbi:hypothetical protein Y032_0287g1439 [Ancylostoma ceylanicum]|uniref:Hexosyltransferase n=1 Tax=Ancylostoma ceylanicum TaxID=53326 RepID=A0A016S6V0_9BILA|nr:hypothetical protein Y032_0287g1439 [Ancylostoma ceylanicum]
MSSSSLKTLKFSEISNTKISVGAAFKRGVITANSSENIFISASSPSDVHFLSFCSETERLHLEEEQQVHGDLALIDNLEEAYTNLALKTLRSMEYAYQNFKFHYVLKVDSDSFVRLGAMIKALKDIQHPRLYWGFLDGRAKPIRKGKWRESDWILCDRYLPYQLGGGYVLSYELVRYLALNSRLLKMYKNEDVSVGAWLAGLDIKYVHDPRFDTEWKSRGCNNEYLITHKKSPAEMEKLYSNLVNLRVLCEKEFRVSIKHFKQLPILLFFLVEQGFHSL